MRNAFINETNQPQNLSPLCLNEVLVKKIGYTLLKRMAIRIIEL